MITTSYKFVLLPFATKFSLHILKLKPQSKQTYNFSSDKRNEHVVIIGAGIIGVTTAIPLLERGYKVTIIEKEKSAATQTSYMNGCVFTPYHHKPMVTMRNVRLFFKSWFTGRSNYHLNLNIMFEKNFWLWNYNALRLSMTQKCMEVNSYRILEIGKESHSEYRRLKLKYPDLFASQKVYSNGQVGLFADEDSLLDYKRILDLKDIPNEVITDIQQFQKYHPDLVNDMNKELIAQYYACLVMPEESSLETGTFTKHAVEFLKQEFPETFDIKFSCEAQSIIFSHEKTATGIQTSHGDIKATQIIYATAAHSRHLAQLKQKVPILPVRGWISGIPYNKLDFKDSPLPLAYHFNIFTSNLFCAPIDGQLRVSGLAHLIKTDGKVDLWGSRQLVDQFNEMFKMDIKEDACQQSQCYRPISPDDGAIIGRLPKFQNIYINNGHGSKGTSHSFGAAKIMFELIDQGSEAETKWNNFKLERFYFI